jgi:hypothetical protein
MKKYLASLLLVGLLAIFASPITVYAARRGDMGFFGGITEGRRLPLTTQTILLQEGNNNNNNRNGRNANTITLEYKEVVFHEGHPLLFHGFLDITSGQPDPNSTSGTFDVRYVVRPNPAVFSEVSINRTMNFVVTYRRVGTQLILSYDINRTNWTETIDTGFFVFTLDRSRSMFNISTLEDQRPGVNYYSGNIFARLVFEVEDDLGFFEEPLIIEKQGDFFGFSSAWSASETHRTTVNVFSPEGWAMQYQIRPSVSVNKDLQFGHNEPTLISWTGNYREVHQSFAGLHYDILVKPQFMWDEPSHGAVFMETINVFEQLHAPDLSFIRGHSAEDDIHRLFAMHVLTGDTRFFIPEQAITRGEFMTALARAIKLPVQDPTPARGASARRQPVAVNLFSDVDSNRPQFRYIQAIQRAGVAFGRADGKFYFDYPITRQEAFATVVRALGLTSLGLNPTVVTPFVDSNNIAYWAMREVGVAHTLGLIAPDANGFIHPTRAISNAEAAALFNHLIEFMRHGLVNHYTNEIVHIVR